MHKESGHTALDKMRSQWRLMTVYERFEQVVAITLSGVIALVIVISLIQLIRLVFTLLVMDALNPLDHKVFQLVFGATMTLLIAMEFKHSIVKVALRKESIIQVKTVILIAILALARKFIILEPDVDPAKVAALAGTVLALGLTYWLMRERDDRKSEQWRHDPLWSSRPTRCQVEAPLAQSLSNRAAGFDPGGDRSCRWQSAVRRDWPLAGTGNMRIDPADRTCRRLRDDLASVWRPSLAP